MRLTELFLRETSEEDRAILSLSSAISKYIQNHAPDINTDQPVTVGKIGDLFNTSIPVLNNITIELQSSDGIRLRWEEENEDTEPNKLENMVIHGLWFYDTNTIVLNNKYIGTDRMRTMLSHELRHALDDIKSEYRAGDSDRYNTPKKKEHREDPENPNYLYLAEPAEINARFVEVLHLLVASMHQAAKKPGIDLKDHAMKELKRLLGTKRIAELFPEQTRSKDYKRLIKRGVDFIDKELAYMARKNKSKPS